MADEKPGVASVTMSESLFRTRDGRVPDLGDKVSVIRREDGSIRSIYPHDQQQTAKERKAEVVNIRRYRDRKTGEHRQEFDVRMLDE